MCASAFLITFCPVMNLTFWPRNLITPHLSQVHQNCKFGENSPRWIENYCVHKLLGHTYAQMDNLKTLCLQHLTKARHKKPRQLAWTSVILTDLEYYCPVHKYLETTLPHHAFLSHPVVMNSVDSCQTKPLHLPQCMASSRPNLASSSCSQLWYYAEHTAAIGFWCTSQKILKYHHPAHAVPVWNAIACNNHNNKYMPIMAQKST